MGEMLLIATDIINVYSFPAPPGLAGKDIAIQNKVCLLRKIIIFTDVLKF